MSWRRSAEAFSIWSSSAYLSRSLGFFCLSSWRFIGSGLGLGQGEAAEGGGGDIRPDYPPAPEPGSNPQKRLATLMISEGAAWRPRTGAPSGLPYHSLLPPTPA